MYIHVKVRLKKVRKGWETVLGKVGKVRKKSKIFTKMIQVVQVKEKKKNFVLP